VPFFWQLATHDKSYVILPQGGHMILLENSHRHFQSEGLHFFDGR